MEKPEFGPSRRLTPMTSWVQVPKNSDFTIYNLPFGIFQNKRLTARIGIAIGDKIVDLSVLHEEGFFADLTQLPHDIFLNDALNDFIALGKSVTKKVRERVQDLLREDNESLREHTCRGKAIVS